MGQLTICTLACSPRTNLFRVSSEVCCYNLHVFPKCAIDVNPSGVCILFEVNRMEMYFFREEQNCDFFKLMI